MRALLLGTVLVAVCVLAGISVPMVKTNPEPLRLTGTIISAFALEEDEKKQQIVNRIKENEAVASVEIQEIVDQDDSDLKILVLTTVPHDNDAISEAVERVSSEAQSLWLFHAPRSITCTISTRPAIS